MNSVKGDGIIQVEEEQNKGPQGDCEMNKG